MRHGRGLPNGLQASSYGARNVLGRKSITDVVKQNRAKKRPNETSSYVVPKFKSPLPQQNMQRQQILTPQAT